MNETFLFITQNHPSKLLVKRFDLELPLRWIHGTKIKHTYARKSVILRTHYNTFEARFQLQGEQFIYQKYGQNQQNSQIKSQRFIE